MGRVEFAFKTLRGHLENGVHQEPYLFRDNLFVAVEGLVNERLCKMNGVHICRDISESFFQHLSETKSPNKSLTLALKETNEAMFQIREPAMETVTSVNAVYVRGQFAYFAHLGHAQIYRFHGETLNLLTRDYVSGLGARQHPAIRVKKFFLQRNDLIVLINGDLAQYVSKKEIRRFLGTKGDLERLCDRLMGMAQRKGDHGNTTVGAVRVGARRHDLKAPRIIYAAVFLCLLSLWGFYWLQPPENAVSLEEQPRRPVAAEPKVAQKSETAPENPRDVLPMGKPMDIQAAPARPEPATGDPLEEAVHAFLRDWKAAWENTAGGRGDIETYLGFYAEDFSSPGLDKSGWKRDKAAKGKRKSWIHITLRDVRIARPAAEHRVVVRFRQDYRSPGFTDTANKVLMLKREPAGWKIASEKSE